MESILVIFPPNPGYSFIGKTENQMADLDIGTLAVAADKMNVFYIGVNNPITVAASGINDNNLSLTATGAVVKKSKEGHYLASCSKPGQSILTVTNKITGQSKNVKFRVKRIPNPTIRLGDNVDGLIGAGEFRAQPGLMTKLENFDMDIRCKIQSYSLYYVCKHCDPIELKGVGNRFTGRIADAIRKAKPGDQYTFTNIKVRCPGDVVGRRMNTLTFKIR